jgi:hypothetical protein
MENPVTKWTGFPKPTNPAPVQEQPWRNIFRPWFVDSGCSRHMTGDISHLDDIQTINDGYVSFAGKEKREDHADGDRNKRCVENGNFVLEMIRFEEV